MNKSQRIKHFYTDLKTILWLVEAGKMSAQQAYDEIAEWFDEWNNFREAIETAIDVLELS